jgi:hypothetical protein
MAGRILVLVALVAACQVCVGRAHTFPGASAVHSAAKSVAEQGCGGPLSATRLRLGAERGAVGVVARGGNEGAAESTMRLRGGSAPPPANFEEVGNAFVQHYYAT